MIYTFVAARTITARIAVETPTLEEAKKHVIARALAGLQNSDFPHRENEHIHFRGTFETWEGVNAAGVDVVVQEDKMLEGGMALLVLLEQALIPDEIKQSYTEAIQEESPVAHYPLGQTEEEKEE